MSRYVEFTKFVGDKVVELAKPAQDAYLDLVASFSQTVGDVIPKMTLPEGLPTQREIVEGSHKMWAHLLASQGEYARRLLEAVSPITSKFEHKASPKPKTAKTTAV